MLVCTVSSMVSMLAIGDWSGGDHLTQAKANELLPLRFRHGPKEMKATELWTMGAISFYVEKDEAGKTMKESPPLF